MLDQTERAVSHLYIFPLLPQCTITILVEIVSFLVSASLCNWSTTFLKSVLWKLVKLLQVSVLLPMSCTHLVYLNFFTEKLLHYHSHSLPTTYTHLQLKMKVPLWSQYLFSLCIPLQMFFFSVLLSHRGDDFFLLSFPSKSIHEMDPKRHHRDISGVCILHRTLRNQRGCNIIWVLEKMVKTSQSAKVIKKNHKVVTWLLCVSTSGETFWHCKFM